MTRNDFCIFILTHGRADNIKTLTTFEKCNYTGPLYFVIDNEDNQEELYRKNFGDKVIQFDKKDISNRYDTADTFNDRRTIFYARNACFEIAKKLGYKYFLELDDDYTSFLLRYISKDGKLRSKPVTKFDELVDYMINFLENTKALSVAFAQGGDLIGGATSKNFKDQIKRKAMNSFFCKTDNPFQFYGRVNEDVNTYTLLGTQGQLFFTIMKIALTQTTTQTNKGGMTGTYLDNGTYVKSFYSILYAPSCVKISSMGAKNQRIHHKIQWNNCTPKIINERYKKK
jgi:hypothetical protein